MKWLTHSLEQDLQLRKRDPSPSSVAQRASYYQVIIKYHDAAVAH